MKNTNKPLWGIEKEALRIDAMGKLSNRPHPFPTNRGQITVDFAEQQSELITRPHTQALAAYYELQELQAELLEKISPERLWPFSLPLSEYQEQLIPAQFAGEPEFEHERNYRRSLLERHVPEKQLYSGIHLNYSMGEYASKDAYFRLARAVLRFKPLLTWLWGVSPPLFDTEAFLASDFEACKPFTLSLRQSPLGYSLSQNLASVLDLRFDNLDEYIDKIGSFMRKNSIEDHRELYMPIRIKPKQKNQKLSTLKDDGISHIEFRFFDLNPHSPLGISKTDLLFFETLITALENFESPLISRAELLKLNQVDERISLCSLLPNQEVLPQSLVDNYRAIEDSLLDQAKKFSPLHTEAVLVVSEKIYGKRPRSIESLKFQLRDIDAKTLLLERAELFRVFSKLELSTQIIAAEALERGFRVQLIDAQENVLRIVNGDEREIIKQATRTSADNYISPLLSENKWVSKKMLTEIGIKVPDGQAYETLSEGLEDFDYWKKYQTVIKPNSTNFGDGVTILSKDFQLADYQTAIERCLLLDSRYLIEKFEIGREYRFLIVDGVTQAVLFREPAHIVGDGLRNVQELVAIKNSDPNRGTAYMRPLEKISLGPTELEYLMSQELNPEHIPALGTKVYLRLNSNISTGGDSVDVTSIMDDFYKRIAEQATLALGLAICGIDMIVPNLEMTAGEYYILELNYNPALHIHHFPSIGKPQNPAGAVLDLLGFRAQVTSDTNRYTRII